MVAAPVNDEDQVVPNINPEYNNHPNGHLNVLAEDHLGEPVDIDDVWPVVPDGVQVYYVWEPWNDPTGEFVVFYAQGPHVVDFQNVESADSSDSEQTKVDLNEV